jgi:hypothetical protein
MELKMKIKMMKMKKKKMMRFEMMMTMDLIFVQCFPFFLAPVDSLCRQDVVRQQHVPMFHLALLDLLESHSHSHFSLALFHSLFADQRAKIVFFQVLHDEFLPASTNAETDCLVEQSMTKLDLMATLLFYSRSNAPQSICSRQQPMSIAYILPLNPVPPTHCHSRLQHRPLDCHQNRSFSRIF